ncbi:uncharacterized protein LOC136000397 [Caloenas nicobarica]|uniref:uncharacterized protein LOC136000397 n=1 Tax=Caloenas nicobarica TaxID=187106 RepID=UPI0032B81D2F
MKFNKGKCRILHRGQGDLGAPGAAILCAEVILSPRQRNPGRIYRLGNEILESSSAETDLQVLFHGKLNTSQQCPWQARGQRVLGASGTALRAGQGGDCPALLCTGAASREALGAVLGARGQKGSKATGECPEEATELVKGLEGKPYEERLNQWVCSAWRRLRPHGGYSFLTRGGGEAGAELFSLATNGRTRENAGTCARGSSAWTLGKGSSRRGGCSTGTGSPGRCHGPRPGRIQEATAQRPQTHGVDTGRGAKAAPEGSREGPARSGALRLECAGGLLAAPRPLVSHRSTCRQSSLRERQREAQQCPGKKQQELQESMEQLGMEVSVPSSSRVPPAVVAGAVSGPLCLCATPLP